jgi:hypothetical protein
MQGTAYKNKFSENKKMYNIDCNIISFLIIYNYREKVFLIVLYKLEYKKCCFVDYVLRLFHRF